MSSAQIRKIILYALLLVVGVLIWRSYQHQSVQNSMHRAAATAAVKANQSSTASTGHSFTPKSFTPAANQLGKSPASVDQSHPIAPAQDKAAASTEQLVHVKTDTLDVAINLATGSIQSLGLPGYPVSITDKSPFALFAQNDQRNYQSQSGLVNSQGQNLAVTYHAEQSNYVMNPGQTTLKVVLTGNASNGLAVTKTYTFTKGSYVVHTQYAITNHGAKSQSYSFYGQLTRQPSLESSSMVSRRAYSGAAVSSQEHPYQEIKYKWLNSNRLVREVQGGWVAQQEQYFISAWIPKANHVNQYYSNTVFKNNDAGKAANVYTVGFVAPAVTIKPGQTATTSARLYAGPEIAKTLKAVAPGLDLSVDYGWLWMLSKLIFTVMAYIESVIHNWGFAIILTTLVIKLCFYKLSEKSYKSMAKMKKLAPKIQALKDRLGDDKAELSKATMELYRKEKVNPAGGCLPMVIQIPFFFALYYVLIDSVQLRQAPFIFWVKDLAVHDPYYVLPILVGLSMFLQQKMSPPPPDPAQAKMMMLLPVIFTVFFLKFPAGLTLYWLTNNVLTVLQQWYVMRKFDDPAYQKKLRDKERQKKRSAITKK